MWKELLLNLTQDCEFHDPVAVFYLDEAETTLNLKLPSDLRELLRESNGIEGQYGLGLLWPLNKILDENRRFREKAEFRHLYMPFDHLLFFADAGNGDQFAFAIHADGQIHRPDIFAWNHEDDSRTWVAPSLRKYFEWWLTGTIKL